ncbi:phage terminase small subunit [Bacillus sp. FJAT-28004]|uniref:phage terminase small subunit n=1 Tax=Bacillus sp. FJAT-28004 TaxID=1679165 RepID=UPI0006B50892|nr:phage terminase small subunit [Bacillus sp. FJAT-28004]
MSRARSPDRERAFKVWCYSGRKMKPSEIASEMGINASLVRKWKSLDRWEEQSDPLPRSRGAPIGSRNALGNRGGPGAPKRNQFAYKTGEYASIWLDALEPDEKILLFEVETDPVTQLQNEMRLLELRERRMLQLRSRILDDWDLHETISKSQLVDEDETAYTIIDHDGKVSYMSVKQPKFMEVERVTKTPQKLERILAIEDALTRVQDKKAKLIDLINKIEMRALSDEEQKLRIEKLKAEINAMNEKAW